MREALKRHSMSIVLEVGACYDFSISAPKIQVTQVSRQASLCTSHLDQSVHNIQCSVSI